MNNWKLTCCECGNKQFTLFNLLGDCGVAEYQDIQCIPCETPLIHISKGKTEVRIEVEDDYDYL